MGKKVRCAVIGVGGMGKAHCESIASVENGELVAVCDMVKETADKMAEKYGAKAFYDTDELFKSGLIDAVVIAVPHYTHTPLTISAFEHGIHVLCEKPVAVHKADAEKMIEAHKKHSDLKFAVMFQLRNNPVSKKVKQLIDDGELGEIMRVNWIITSWFRSQTYYDGGTWRATWKGEGGGVLLNQCPHQLDLFQWFFGMPVKVRAFCSLGKYHDIEVEDDVTAYCEYKNGATGIFIASTGEIPGTNRLEITGDRGRLILENQKISFVRTEVSVKEFTRKTDLRFGMPDCWNIEIPVQEEKEPFHKLTIKNFFNAILYDEPIIAPGEEGIYSVELANAMLYSGLTNEVVDMPLDAVKFETLLNKLIKESKFEKKTVKKVSDKEDFSSSFHK